MLTRSVVPLALGALALLSTPAFAIGARSQPLKFAAQGVTSIATAAKVAPGAAAATGADAPRENDREQKHQAMVEKLASSRRSLLTAAQLAASTAALPHLTGLHLADENEGASGFNGINNFDQSAVNSGFSVEPPDQGLCVGNGFVFEGVNDAFSVYSENGGLRAGPAQSNAFFGVPFALNVSDPKCLYDPASNRWFVTMIEYDNLLSNNGIMLAVSQTGDPTGSFVVYRIDVTKDGSDFFPGDCPCLGDQPLIGADANGFYVSTNAFGVFSFQGAQVYAISKAALVKGAASPPGVHFDQLSFLLPDVEFSFSIQPSSTSPGTKGDPGTEYLAQSMRARTLENRIAVWTVNNTAALDGDLSKLSMSTVVIPTESYAQPVSATQKAGPTPLAERAAINDFAFGANEQNLDGSDQRMSQVMYRNGQLWTAIGTAAASDGSPVRDAIAWLVVNVSNPAAGPQASMAAQGYLAGPESSHLVYPAMAVNSKGNASMVFTLTGPQFFPSAAYWNFGSDSIHLLADGAVPQDGFSAYFFNRPRWGDYSAAAVAGDGSIWLATEFIPGGARKVFANWGTFVGRIHQGD